MIVFAFTKFGLVRIQGRRVKRRGGGGGIRPPRPERVFEIPVQIGLIAICEFDEKFVIRFNEDSVAQMLSFCMLLDCEGYSISDVSCRIEIELVFNLCPVLFR